MVIRMKIDDNKGYSLVEIIIVVTIISIVAGTVGYGLSLSSGKPAVECAQKLSAELSHARVMTMGKNKLTVTVGKDSSDRVVINYLQKTTDTSTEVSSSTLIGAGGVKLEVSKDKTNWTEITGDSGTFVTLEFSRSTGALKPSVDGGNEYYQYFRITKAHVTQYVVIVPLTGKIQVKDTI